MNKYSIIEKAWENGGYVKLTLEKGTITVDPILDDPAWYNLPYLKCNVISDLENIMEETTNYFYIRI